MSLLHGASTFILAAMLANSVAPAQLRAADPWEEIRKDTEKNPDEVIGCGVGGPESVYTTRAICFAVMNLYRDRRIKPSAASELLQMCGSMSTSV